MTALVLAAIVLIEFAAITVLAVLYRRTRRKLAEVEAATTDHQRTQRLVTTGREAVKQVWNTANLVRKKGFGAAFRTSIEELADWADVERPDLARLTVGGTVVIFFSDIENSTLLNEEFGDRTWVKLLGRHDRTIRKCVERNTGHVVKCQGDGFMVAFAYPIDAVRCSADIQKEFGDAASWARRHDIRVRIGIHMGRSVRRGEDLFGRNVAMAARVADQASGGETLLSEPVHDAVQDEVEIAGSREVQLKGFAGTHRVYAVQ